MTVAESDESTSPPKTDGAAAACPAPLGERWAHLTYTLGEPLVRKAMAVRLLVVGAGGIGCELLKDLLLVGVQHIEVVDLDTIDVSNLNRQFLFRPHHVGQPKALVAREMVQRLNPDARIVAHHSNIKLARFGLDYFRGFDVVINALDNVSARAHVNRLCLATDRPLVEAGTTGYAGQAYVIRKGETECYECREKATPKTYPLCTIRATPDKPVHCIVWAKELFKLVFGGAEGARESMLAEPVEDGPDGASVYMPAVLARPGAGAGAAEYVRGVVDGLYRAEIAKQLSMDKYKGAKHTPVALQAEDVARACGVAGGAEGGGAPPPPPPIPSRAGAGWERRAWSADECIGEMCACAAELAEHAAPGAEGASFDKDDRRAMRFVCAAANLRARVFHIEPQSFHDAKGIAGNIIPAIATTNAIVAAWQTQELLEMLKLMEPGPDGRLAPPADAPLTARCKLNSCSRDPSGNRRKRLFQPQPLDAPKPSCFVCSKRDAQLRVDTEATTFRELLDGVLKGSLRFNEPTVMLGDSTIWEEGDDAGDFAQNLAKTLAALPAGGVVDGVTLAVEDFSQELELNVQVYHKSRAEFDEEGNTSGFELVAPDAAPTVCPTAAAGAAAAADDDDDELEVLEDAPAAASEAPAGEAEDADEAGPPAAKRAKTAA